MVFKTYFNMGKADESAAVDPTLKPPPVKVSPLIRGTRWSLLILGILYGAFKQKFLSEREAVVRVEENKKKEKREAKIKAEKAEASEREMAMLIELFLGTSAESNGHDDHDGHDAHKGNNDKCGHDAHKNHKNHSHH